MAADTVAEHQFFIKLVSSYLRQVITSRVKEHAGDQAFRTINCQRLSRTDLLIQLQKSFLIVGCRILFKARHDLRLFAKQLDDLRICTDSQRTDQHSDRYLSSSIYSYIKNVIGISLILQPCPAVRDHGRRKQSFA